MRSIAANLRKHALSAVVALLLVSVSHAARAQVTITTDVAWPGLTQDDLARMREAATRLYEGRSIGTVERWRSPDSKNAGEIKLVRSFDSHGMPCRALDYTIRFDTVRNNPTRYVMTWCKVQGDQWKIVELPRSH